MKLWDAVNPSLTPLFREALLIEPLRWRDPLVWILRDIFHPVVPFVILEDVFYLMQKASWHTFLIPTEHADRLRAFALDSFEMRGLISRNRHIRYIAMAEASLAQVGSMAAAPLPYREVQVAGHADLTRWLPHDFSFNPQSPGTCEFCEETIYADMHDNTHGRPQLTLVRCAAPSDFLVAQCSRGMVELSTEVV